MEHKWTCKYATPTDRPWAGNLPCVEIECSCPERCKKIPADKAGFHTRYVKDRLDVLAVRSIFCGPKCCNNYEKKED